MKVPLTKVHTFPYQLEDLNPFQRKFHDFVKRVTYKPGTVFFISPGNLPTQVKFEARIIVNNLTADGTTAPLSGRPIIFEEFLIGNLDDPDIVAYVLRRVFAILIEMETHEAQEWFFVDGACLNDPHRNEF